MITADIIIIGAGPAGASAAKYLAETNLKTLLIDSAVFPREKACGDGVTADGIEALRRLGLGEWSRQFAEMDILRLTSPDSQILDIEIQAKDGRCNGRTIPRRILDNRLVQHALDHGAHLLENTHIKHLEFCDDGAIVSSNHEVARGKLILLAEGSHASLTRKLGLSQKQTSDLMAIRQYLHGDTGPANRLELHFHSWILPGYSWIFPLGDGKLNIGTGTYTRRVRSGEINLPAALQRFKTDTIHQGRMRQAVTAGPIKGHPLRTHFGKSRTHTERILVLGDSAGLINPFSGEGIAPALISGEIAAKTAIHAFEKGDFSAKTCAAYSQDIRNRFLPDRKAARFLRNAMNKPWILNRLFEYLQTDAELAMLVALMIIGQKSPRLILKPSNLARFLRTIF